MKPLSIGFDVPFSEAIAQAKARGVVLPSVYYGELQGVARQLAFSVAGLASLDQLQAVKESLDKAMGEGLTFGEWKKQQATKDMNLPAHRLDNIFRTNLQGNYMAGKWQQFMVRANDDSPRQTYLLYDAVNDSRVRPSHLAMDGVIRRVDDPYWATHSPPNGYRCRCSLTTLSEAEAQARSGIGRGLHKTPTLPDGRPAEPDKGWDYNPYQDRLAGVRKAVLDRRSQCGGLFSAAHLAGKKRHNTPMWCDEKNYAGILLRSLQGYAFADGKMPEPRKPQGVEKLSSILSEHNLFARFMREFGDDDSVEFTDVIGNRLLIDKSLFEDINGNWKIMKGERAPWLLYTAINIKKPDEIWLERGRQGGNDRLYYLSQFDIGMKGLMSCLAVFDRKQEHAGLWGGRTNYATTQFGYMIRKRDKEIKGEIKYWRWE